MYIYHGTVFCTVLKENTEYSVGMRGAFIPVACKADTFANALKVIQEELIEIHLTLEGCEEFYQESYFYGIPNKAMQKLIDRLECYPVQFESVHYFPPDDLGLEGEEK